MALGEVADVNPESLDSSTPGDFLFRYIDLGCVSTGTIDWSGVAETRFLGAPSRARRVVRGGDVLFGTVRPALRSHAAIPCAPLDVPLVASTGFAVIRACEGRSDARFLCHYVLGPRAASEARAREVGSNYPAVNESDVRRFGLSLPPLPEQRRIAEILDTVDEAIRKTEEIIAKLKQVKQGLLHDLLTRGIDDNGELRDPDRHPDQFKDSPLGRIPRAWAVRPLAELAVAPICYGIVQAGAYVPGGPYVLMIRDLNGDFRTGLHRTSLQIDKSYSRSRTAPGDLLLSIKGTVGRANVVPSWYEGNISRDLARLRFGVDVVPAFASHYFRSASGTRRLELAVVGTTRAEISIHVLKRLTMPIPSPNEQGEIAKRVDALELQIMALDRDQKKLAALERGLMEDLLTGRVRALSGTDG